MLSKQLVHNRLCCTNGGAGDERGFVLISVIMFMMLFMILGMVLMYKVTATVKMSGIHKTGLMRFQGAEGGAIAVASYMSKYRQTNIPEFLYRESLSEAK